MSPPRGPTPSFLLAIITTIHLIIPIIVFFTVIVVVAGSHRGDVPDHAEAVDAPESPSGELGRSHELLREEEEGEEEKKKEKG